MASPTASGNKVGNAAGQAVPRTAITRPCSTRQGRSCRPAPAATQGGFTYLWLLFVLAISAAGTAALGELSSVQVQRSKELDLTFRGNAIAAALASYRAASPANTPCAPEGWAQLLLDQRITPPLRHLRQPYGDPFAPSGEWELIKDTQDRLLGVKSRPISAPIVTAPPPAGKAGPTVDATGARVFQASSAATKLGCINAPPTATVGSVDTQDSMKPFQNK